MPINTRNTYTVPNLIVLHKLFLIVKNKDDECHKKMNRIAYVSEQLNSQQQKAVNKTYNFPKKQ